MKNLQKISAKKSLGQNFLHAPHIVGKMVHVANIESGMTVLEVGPGKGVLTSALVENAEKVGARVVAVEKDDRMIPVLEEKFTKEIDAGLLTLIHGDILELSNEKFIKNSENSKYVVVANIPYYITGELIRKFLENERPPERMVLMVQKEVAKRIVSREQGREGKESILSVSVKVFGNPSYVETVPARHFRPVPNVDSAVILIESISDSFFREGNIDKKAFFVVLKAGFAHKRKVLIKNLEVLATREKLNILWKNLGLNEKVRAEDIPIKTWAEIAKISAII